MIMAEVAKALAGIMIITGWAGALLLMPVWVPALLDKIDDLREGNRS